MCERENIHGSVRNTPKNTRKEHKADKSQGEVQMDRRIITGDVWVGIWCELMKTV